MKYMLLMQGTQSDWANFSSYSRDDLKAMLDFMNTLDSELRESGELIYDDGLTGPDQAKIVRAHNGGAPAISEGPFPESKEFVAGYWVVDCATPERVIELAAHISAQPGPGGEPANIPVEVRPVGEAPEV